MNTPSFPAYVPVAPSATDRHVPKADRLARFAGRTDVTLEELVLAGFTTRTSPLTGSAIDDQGDIALTGPDGENYWLIREDDGERWLV